MGKPAKIIYEAAAEMLGLAPSDVIAIGDSLARRLVVDEPYLLTAVPLLGFC